MLLKLTISIINVSAIPFSEMSSDVDPVDFATSGLFSRYSLILSTNARTFSISEFKENFKELIL